MRILRPHQDNMTFFSDGNPNLNLSLATIASWVGGVRSKLQCNAGKPVDAVKVKAGFPSLKMNRFFTHSQGFGKPPSVLVFLKTELTLIVRADVSLDWHRRRLQV